MKHCCERMETEVTKTCQDHPDPFTCPDRLVNYMERFDEYGLVVHDGGNSSVLIAYCPWCGIRLPPSRRDAWFHEVRARGVDPWTDDDLPQEYRSDAWYRGRVS